MPLRPYVDSFPSDVRAEAFRESLAMLPADRDPERTELTAAVNFASADVEDASGQIAKPESPSTARR